MKHKLAISIVSAVLFLLIGIITVSAQGSDKATLSAPTSTPAAAADRVVTTTVKSTAKAKVDTCYDCHAELLDKHPKVAADWKDSVHGAAGVSCADCHGGDPTLDQMKTSMSAAAGFIGVPDRTKTPEICGACHSNVERMRQYNLPTDQYSKYKDSVHGAKLAEGVTQVAICSDCHGSHAIKKASDPTADVYPLNVPALCSRCHSDAKMMEPFNIPTNQFDVYKSSVHGEALLGKQDVRAPNCASCHGSHDAKPPTSAEVVNVCGKCHTATQNYYEQSLHSQLKEAAPKCWTCHGNHDVTKPDENMFTHTASTEPVCTTCHDIQTLDLIVDKAKFANPDDRRCDTCHHQDSWIYEQVLSLKSAMTVADLAYKQGDVMIAEAIGRGMIMNDAESRLAEARTSLISARAAIHTTKLTEVTKLTDKADASAKEAQQMASDKLGENLFRREAMFVAMGVIITNIGILAVVRRRLYKELE